MSRADLWSEVVLLHGARAIATFEGGVLDGRPAVTEHAYGEGKAVYLATRLEAPVMAALLERICHEVDVEPVAETAPGIEAMRRGPYLFLVDHRNGEVTVKREVRMQR